MTIIAVLDLQFAADDVEASLQALAGVLKDTRAFPGCLGVDVVQDVKDPTHVQAIERWASAADDQAYRDWRAGAGASTVLGSLIVAPPGLVVSELRDDV
jgi:quinol monooxygenase YgiN